MLSTFDVCLKEIEDKFPAKAADISALLDRWRVSSALAIRVVDNLKTDTRIRISIMHDILETLYANKSLSIPELETNIYKLKCYRNTLTGPVIDKSRLPSFVGGAKPVEDFATIIRAKVKSISKTDVDSLVTRLCTPGKALTSTENELEIAAFSCWCTWSETGSNDPFDFAQAPLQVLKIVVNLGLSHRQSQEDHILLVYPVSVLDEIYVPTIADAVLYEYFKCASSTDYSGRTQPWNTQDYKDRGIKSEEVKPRPEGVHRPVKLRDLKRPVQLITK